MMSVRDYFYDATLHFESSRRTYEMIELPYVGGRFVMQILMPYSDKIFEDLPKASDVGSLFEQQKWESKTIVILPKFKLSSSADLRKPLESAGMRDMFKWGCGRFFRNQWEDGFVRESCQAECGHRGQRGGERGCSSHSCR